VTYNRVLSSEFYINQVVHQLLDKI